MERAEETVGVTEEAVLFARSASVGAQQFPVHWGGDCCANYESMAEKPARRAVPSACQGSLASGAMILADSGIPRRRVIYKRWCVRHCSPATAACAFSKSYHRVPWAYDDEVTVTWCALLRRTEVPDDAVSVSGSGARQRSTDANDAGDDGRFPDDRRVIILIAGTCWEMRGRSSAGILVKRAT